MATQQCIKRTLITVRFGDVDGVEVEDPLVRAKSQD